MSAIVSPVSKSQITFGCRDIVFGQKITVKFVFKLVINHMPDAQPSDSRLAVKRKKGKKGSEKGICGHSLCVAFCYIVSYL